MQNPANAGSCLPESSIPKSCDWQQDNEFYLLMYAEVHPEEGDLGGLGGSVCVCVSMSVCVNSPDEKYEIA